MSKWNSKFKKTFKTADLETLIIGFYNVSHSFRYQENVGLFFGPYS